MDRAVIDASVAIKWTIGESGSEEALRLVQTTLLVAPRLILIECANVLWVKSRRMDITSDDAAEAYAYIAVAPIDYLEDGDLLPAALALAGLLDHSVYDCLYVAASVAIQAPIVTADRKLHRKLSETRPVMCRSLLLSDLAA